MNTNLTPSGVCYDLKNTPFHCAYDGYEWYFSSHTHLLKFQQKARIKTDWLSDSLTNRFHFTIEASQIALFQLYRQVETRGFYVIDYDKAKEYNSISDINMKVVLNG